MRHSARAHSFQKLFLLDFVPSLKFPGFLKTVLTLDSYYFQQGLKSVCEYRLFFYNSFIVGCGMARRGWSDNVTHG
jgi:hypothetical protein